MGGAAGRKEKIDQEGENYGPQDLLDQLNDPHVDAALDTIGLWAEGRMVAYVTYRLPL